MIDKDTRPTKAQFAAMPLQERQKHLEPLMPAEVDETGKELPQKPYPQMTSAEFKAIRTQLGLSHNDLAIKLKLRGLYKGHIPYQRVQLWEEGNIKEYGAKAVIPGPVALKMQALRG